VRPAVAPLTAAQRLEAVLETAPAAIALLEGPEHRFTLTNRGYRELVGGRDLVGKTVREALPEVEGQGFFELLDEVLATGEASYGSETPVLLDRGGGTLAEIYVNFAYLPVRSDEDGAPDGILVHAVDVSELVTARRTVEALAERLRAERGRLETLIEQMPAGVVIAEVPSGRLVAANQEWREFFGFPFDAIEDVERYAVFAAYRPDGSRYEPHEYPLARTVATGETVVGEQLVLDRADGERRIIEVNSAPVVVDGEMELGVATFFDVTEERRAASLVAGNKALLELVAGGSPLAESLDGLVRMIEEQAEGRLLASVLLLDRDGKHLRHGSAPSLPAAYNEAIDGLEVGPSAGSCGTAAHRRASVVVRDVATDPLWADFRDLALEHGLASCWSTPILSAAGEVLGTFAIYYTEARGPAPGDEALVELATRTAAIAIERKRLEEEREALLEAEHEARTEAERSLELVRALNGVGLAINASLDLEDVVQVVTDAATRLTGAEFGAFFYNVIRSDGGAYTLYALSGAPRSAFERYPMPRNTEIFDPTFRGTAIMRLDDVTADPRFGRNAPYHGMPKGHLPVRSYLAVPVKTTENEVLGGLFFGHKDVGVFTEAAERLAVGIAAQAAVAIERARLYVREQYARAEAEQRAQAALSLEHVTDGVCLVGADGVVGTWNAAATAITGVPGEAAIGRPLAEAVPALAAVVGDLAASDPADARVVTTNVRIEVDGRDAWLGISATRFPDGVVYTFRDRTEEQRLEEIRSEIVATVSHELRTPLAAVYGAAKTLARPDLAQDAQVREQFVEMIAAETERLTRVVNQILVTSDLEKAVRGIDEDEVDAAAAVRSVVELAQLRADGVALELDLDEAPRVRGDADKLQQVLANLVDNAFKYGRSGGRVAVRLESRGDRVRLSVSDWGPGVPPREAARIFERFYRLDPDQRGGVAGTGLGLYISRAFVRQMGGEMWVEQTAGGRGATFVVELLAA